MSYTSWLFSVSLVLGVVILAVGWFLGRRRSPDDHPEDHYWPFLTGAFILLAWAGTYVVLVARIPADASAESSDILRGPFRASLRGAIPTVLSAMAASVFAVWAVVWTASRSRSEADTRQRGEWFEISRRQESQWLRERTDLYDERRATWTEDLRVLNRQVWPLVQVFAPPHGYWDSNNADAWLPWHVFRDFSRVLVPVPGSPEQLAKVLLTSPKDEGLKANGALTRDVLDRLVAVATQHYRTWLFTSFGTRGNALKAMEVTRSIIEARSQQMLVLAQGQRALDMGGMVGDVDLVGSLLLRSDLNESERAVNFVWLCLVAFVAQAPQENSSTAEPGTLTSPSEDSIFVLTHLPHLATATTLLQPTLLRHAVISALEEDEDRTGTIAGGNVASATDDLLRRAAARFNAAKGQYPELSQIVGAILMSRSADVLDEPWSGRRSG